MYFFYILFISFIFYCDLMVQVIFTRWCAHLLATLSLTCSRVLVPVVGQRPLDLIGASPPPPRPPPMSIKQMLVIQNELMRVLTENLVHQGGR
jgi:hypothetical protein